MHQPSSTDSRHSLEHWVRALADREMPAFAHTARLIAGEASRNETSASELARVVLQDVSTTTRLLRMANSFYYNPSRTDINTVSRAVVVLGFETVRNICLSISIVDSFLEGERKAWVSQEMARSFHAGLQAKTLAKQRGDRSPEEVFVATLLYHLGGMAFWCFSDAIDADTADRLERALAHDSRPTDQIEREVLGFTLAELTQGLNREWHLSSLLGETLEHGAEKDPRAGNVILGYEIAEAAEKGWEHEEVQRLIERAAESAYMPVDAFTALVHENARDAALSMSKLGATNASRLIPMPGEFADALKSQERETRGGEGRSRFPESDQGLQLKILRELAQSMVERQPDVNLILEMVMEGLHRGVGLDRTVFALLEADRKSLRAKFTLGWDRSELSQHFHFRLAEPGGPSIFDHAVQSNEPLWVPRVPNESVRSMLTPEIERVAGNAPFFVMPLSLQGRVIGLLYADRKPSRRDLTQTLFDSFKLFGQQAQLALSYLKGN